MPISFDEEPKSFEEVLERVNTSPTLRKIKTWIDNLDASADVKAMLYDIAKVTIKVGETVIAIGRRVFEIAHGLVAKFPNMAMGLLVGLVVSTLILGPLGAITIAGKAPFAGLAALFSKLIVLLGVGKGFFEDLRANAAKSQMDKVAAEFDILGTRFAQS